MALNQDCPLLQEVPVLAAPRLAVPLGLRPVAGAEEDVEMTTTVAHLQSHSHLLLTTHLPPPLLLLPPLSLSLLPLPSPQLHQYLLPLVLLHRHRGVGE